MEAKATGSRPSEDTPYNITLIVGSANQKLGHDIAKFLKINPATTEIATFADGEWNIQIKDNMRGADAFIIQ